MKMKYPKIETLFNRDEKFKVIEGQYRLPEFENIKKWFITEKIDGTNVRVIYQPVYETTGFISLARIQKFKEMELLFKGRTDKAEFHPNLMKYLEQAFTIEKFAEVFPDSEEFPMYPSVTLFGEGYGPKIQKGGNYRKDISFRLFDVFIKDQKNPLGGWWLEPPNVGKIADQLEISYVPILPISTIERSVEYVKKGSTSVVSRIEGGNPDYPKEGIIARTFPLLFTRKGERLMWKLKTKDFAV